MKNTILLVDDDPSILAVWERQLASLDVTVLKAQTIADAIEQMKRIPPPDLVLLDLVVPPHTAAETVAEIDALRSFNKDLAIIAISGMDIGDIAKVVADARVEAIANKQETSSQIELLRVMQSALDKGMTSSALLAHVSDEIRRLQA